MEPADLPLTMGLAPQEIIDEKSSRENTRQIVAKTLQIPNDQSWFIESSDRDLVMIHYDHDAADLSVYGKLRGVVVDINKRVMVANSYGYTPTATADAIMPDFDNNFILTDQTGLSHVIDLNKSYMKYGLEGVLIRVFKWDGKVYYTSHRRFDISRSRWGDSLPFLNIYEMLGGPPGEDLFPENERFSPVVHFFLAEHPGLLHVTKMPVGSGFLFYLEYRIMWSTDPADSPFRMTDEEGNPRLAPNQTLEEWENDSRPNIGFVSSKVYVPKTRSTLPMFEPESTNQSPEIISLSNLQLGEANTLLRYGYYQAFDDSLVDPRLRTGEFIVIYKPDGTLLRVESSAYRWRADMADDNPNRRHRFYELTDAATKLNPVRVIDDRSRFRRLFPAMIPWKIEDVKTRLEKQPIIIWDERDNRRDPIQLDEIRTVDQRIYNIWACLMMASPINRQSEIVNYYQEYYQDFNQLVSWIYQLYEDGYPNGIEDPKEKIVSLLKKVNYQTQRQISRQRGNHKNLNYSEIFKAHLPLELKREPGRVLYQLTVFMKKSLRASETESTKVGS